MLLAEGIQRNDRAFLLFLAGFGSLGSGSGLCLMGNGISGDLRVFDFFLFGQRHIELELEIDGRIVETANGVVRDDQLFRRIREGQADFEAGFGYFQVPELMLDNDGHLLGIFRLEVLGNPHARRAGQEGDEEVMVAGQTAGCGHFPQNLTNNAAKGILCENVVTDMILPHAVLSFPYSNVFSCTARLARQGRCNTLNLRVILEPGSFPILTLTRWPSIRNVLNGSNGKADADCESAII
ncbi:hypothetical protein AGR7C_Cc110171 [Agrobacterium deltaense Zutra 3/1]|uniref:Uncharacterized protein n=1 Tax=Agrobacterium deltaense Zutra 3/1 TaxID=1183427 RepID=A0A1S7P0S1_9HYPH|nr:hypothetical protein AGR7C_Cc110171 [Agrobacterium deltaense Zutra 3/1]